MKDIAILIPTLNPDDKLINLVKDLQKIDFENIFIVDDWSDEKYQEIFDELEKIGCIVYHHKINKWKWEALKTWFKNIANYKNIIWIITVDGDWQHLPKDIKKVAKELKEKDEIILWTRVFDSKNMPLKSRLWNYFSSLYFSFITWKKLTDTQTWLRWIPIKYIPFALKVLGSRYEYEMRFLEEMYKHNLQFFTVDIEAVYDKDRTTHFQAIKDSYIIYKQFFRNIIASITSAVLDIGLFMMFVKFWEEIIFATILARLISWLYNFVLNKIWTFEKKNSKNTKAESRKYMVLFIVSMILSGIVTEICDKLFVSSDFWLLILKIIIDVILFFVNFVVQKNWVFKDKKNIENEINF